MIRDWLCLQDLPRLVRIARRGRPFDETAQEAGVSTNTLRRAEAGEAISIESLQRLINWTDHPLLIEPQRDGRSPELPLDEEPTPEKEADA